MDSVVWERSPSPDHYFVFRSSRSVTAGGMTFESASESKDMRESRCDGTPASATFGGTAAVGSINRLLPKDSRLFPTREDRFLGYEECDAPGSRRRASVWGWFEHDGTTGGEVGFHKVYVSVRTGWPMREEQALYSASGGPGDGLVLRAEATFTFDHQASAVSEGWYMGLPRVEGSIFDPPEDCSVSRRSSDPLPGQAVGGSVAHSWAAGGGVLPSAATPGSAAGRGSDL